MSNRMHMKWLLPAMAVLTICSCDGGSSDDGKMLYVMNGTFEGDDYSGKISNWRLYDDGTSRGTWITADELSINFSGRYTLDGDDLSMQGKGTSRSPDGETYQYTLKASGIYNGQSMSGSYEITYADSYSDYGTWQVSVKETDTSSGGPQTASDSEHQSAVNPASD